MPAISGTSASRVEQIEQQRVEFDDREKDYRNQHHHHQKARPAARVLPRIAARIGDGQFLARLPGKDRLVFGAVIFEDPLDIVQPRKAPDHRDKECHPDHSVDEIEATEGRTGVM